MNRKLLDISSDALDTLVTDLLEGNSYIHILIVKKFGVFRTLAYGKHSKYQGLPSNVKCVTIK